LPAGAVLSGAFPISDPLQPKKPSWVVGEYLWTLLCQLVCKLFCKLWCICLPSY
jgi:hypothetical protein